MSGLQQAANAGFDEVTKTLKDSEADEKPVIKLLANKNARPITDGHLLYS
jgi:hypothetical protein